MLIEGRQGLETLAQDPDPKMPQGVLELVAGVLAGGDRKDLVEFFQREGLGLGHEEQDEHPADQTPGRVPAEGALGLEGREQARPGEGEDEVEAPSLHEGKQGSAKGSERE
jgi:hypothetical protein